MHIQFKVAGLEFLAEIKATPFIPANTSGPPEYCSPAEGGEIEEWESLEVVITTEFESQDGIKIKTKKNIDAYYLLESDFMEKIEEAAYQSLAEYTPEYDCDFDY